MTTTSTTEATMDLTTQTPAQIDETLASLYAKVYDAEDALARAWRDVHYAAGDRQVRRSGWQMTNTQALAAAQAKLAAETMPYRVDEIKSTLDAIAERNAAVAAAEVACQPYEAEYSRRPWTRFFLVEDGHIHSSMYCSTCNKNGQRTRFGWNPELSGKSMADAIAHFEAQAKGRSEVLCSVCYPDAPREWMVRPVDPNICPGSGTRDYRDGRAGYAAGNGAVCTHCGEWRAVSNRGYGNLVKHKKA